MYLQKHVKAKNSTVHGLGTLKEKGETGTNICLTSNMSPV